MLVIDQEKIKELVRQCQDRWKTFRYRTAVELAIMAAAGIGCIGFSANDDWHFYYEGTAEPVPVVTVPVAEEETETEPETSSIETAESTEPETEEEAEPEPSALRMNMAGYFPDGADTSDSMNSYAGKAFARLSEKDASWIQEIYGISKRTPAEVGASLGKNLEKATSTDYWKDVVTTFVDGDGTPISGYSNAKEILSLASVYTFYQNPDDGQAFLNYADALWKVSHSYKISVSDLYYCDGSCVENGSRGLPGIEVEEDTTEETGHAETDTVPEETTTVSREELESKMEEESMSDLLESANPLEAAKMYEILYVTEAEESSTDSKEASTGETVAAEGENQDASQSAGDAQSSVKETQIVKTAQSKPECPGHVDLRITAYITGYDEKNNLFAIDPIGNQEENQNENWAGWDKFRKLCATRLEQQDWYEEYGLTVSTSMYVRNPLSSSEINRYLSLLPSGTSAKRRKIVEEALKSVGCIPYYWGGKPSTSGLDGNHFGTMVSPDKNGRNLRGLDCSGWVSWVYWTALGQHLQYESTSGLLSLGNAVKRQDLKPGDIILRTGDDSHVFLFLAWTDSSKRSMYLIHETGNSTNNVMVGTYNIDWPFYRNLLGEE